MDWQKFVVVMNKLDTIPKENKSLNSIMKMLLLTDIVEKSIRYRDCDQEKHCGASKIHKLCDLILLRQP